MAKDYAADAVPRLAGQFYESKKLVSLIAAIVDPLTLLEGHADDLMADRWIDTAIGRQLDGCGYIVGVFRRGRSDEEYREAIKYRIFVNTSTATPQDLVRGLKFLTSPTDCQYLEAWPATAILFTNGINIPTGIQAQMQDLAPAAISDVPVCVSYDGKPFRFSRDVQVNPFGELFVNDLTSYLTANGSDIFVTKQSVGPLPQYESGLGGVVPSDLEVAGAYLDVGGPTLAVYNRNTVGLLGHDNLTGVFQA